ncbi:MAG: hypothetical protein NC218_05590 [Acetobacter sp.]|nr:hypothetical protein [Acetobacter sp.]
MENFWKKKKLSDFSEEEWESVCMRCGKCCLFKHSKNNKIYFTNHMCDGYDFKTGKCSRYTSRLGSTCTKVDMRLLYEEAELLPETCAYRLLLAGKELPSYHPLVSGNPSSAHEAMQTVLEMPNIRSTTEIDKILNENLQVLCDENSTPEKNTEALAKLENIRPIYIEIYDIPYLH